MCVTKMRNGKVNSLAALLHLTPIKHKQLDRVVTIKNIMIAGLAFRIEEKNSKIVDSTYIDRG